MDIMKVDDELTQNLSNMFTIKRNILYWVRIVYQKYSNAYKNTEKRKISYNILLKEIIIKSHLICRITIILASILDNDYDIFHYIL